MVFYVSLDEMYVLLQANLFASLSLQFDIIQLQLIN